MNAVYVEFHRVGSIMRIEGEPPSSRWFAFTSNARKKGFPTRKAAIAWLAKLHEEDTPHVQLVGRAVRKCTTS